MSLWDLWRRVNAQGPAQVDPFAMMNVQAHAEEAANNFSADEREVIRACELHGAITADMAERFGWTFNGQAKGPLAELVRRKVIAPRCLTSQPLRIIWQLRTLAGKSHNEARIAREASRRNLKEYAPGGFQLELRRELRR